MSAYSNYQPHWAIRARDQPDTLSAPDNPNRRDSGCQTWGENHKMGNVSLCRTTLQIQNRVWNENYYVVRKHLHFYFVEDIQNTCYFDSVTSYWRFLENGRATLKNLNQYLESTFKECHAWHVAVQSGICPTGRLLSTKYGFCYSDFDDLSLSNNDLWSSSQNDTTCPERHMLDIGLTTWDSHAAMHETHPQDVQSPQVSTVWEAR